MKQICYLLVALLLLSCGKQEQELQVVQGKAFGTTYGIQYFSSESFNAKKGIDSIVNRINLSVSTYMPESDISKINRGDSTIVVDSMFREVYRISEKVYKQSNGYFDPTIGVLRNAYGFGEDSALLKLDGRTLDSLQEFVGFDKVRLLSDGTIKKTHPAIYFDFNAIAKGYGIDILGNYLENNGVENYLIELGGELLAKGKNIAKDKDWIVGIEATDSKLEGRSAVAKVTLQDRGMASSGNYRKYRIDSITGQKYVHTINPLTGLAEQSDVTSATVMATSCALADAYATTFMAMGFEKSVRLLKSLQKVEAYLTYTDSGNIEQVYTTPGMQRILLRN